MSETTAAVGPDFETPHALVVIEAFTGSLAADPRLKVPVAKGTVLAVATLGQTNVHAGMGPRHPKAALIEHATAKPGDVLPDAEVAAGLATAAAKQALVPEQQKAREAHRQAAMAAQAKVIPDLLARVEALEAKAKAVT